MKAGYGLLFGGLIIGTCSSFWSQRTFAGFQELALRKFNERQFLLSLQLLL